MGETNRLEQVAAEARARELQNRLATTLVDISVQHQQLGLLLGTGTGRIDTLASVVAPLTAADTAALSADANPTLGLLRQQVSQSQLQTRVEQLRRLPDVRAGYFNQSINKERSFQVGQAGVSLPLLGGVQKSRVAAARIGEQVADQQLTYATAQLAGQAAQLRLQLARARASLDYYEQAALPQAQPDPDYGRKKLPCRRHRLRDLRSEHRARLANSAGLPGAGATHTMSLSLPCRA